MAGETPVATKYDLRRFFEAYRECREQGPRKRQRGIANDNSVEDKAA